MSRAGRGGGTHGGRSRGPTLPFEIDPELAEVVDQAEEEGRSSDDDFQKDLFPDLTEYIMAAPITDEERHGVQIEREMQAKRRAGPFWMGTRDEWAKLDATSGGSFDPFENVPTYSRKRVKKPFQLANLKRIKVCYPEFLPKELHSVVTDNDDEDASGEQRKKKLGLAKKSTVDRLAKLDDDEVIGNTDAEADSDEDDDKEENEDDFERSPGDDEFEEDEEEADNDYNAEKYFNDGEDGFDDFGGEEYGEDGL